MGMFGPLLAAMSTFIAFATAFAAAPLIAWGTGGRTYLARRGRAAWAHRGAIACSICEHPFEPEDMAYCPVYSGPICSLCCTLEARCRDMCKPRSRFSEQVADLLAPATPRWTRNKVDHRVFPFFGILLLFSLAIAALLGLIGYEYGILAPAQRPVIDETLRVVFLALFILSALAAWLLVLAHASRRAAEDESGHQTTMLLDEITAHQRTDAALKKAKAAAESANTAKSRYIVGVIHEIRAPLNAIFGYAQLLENGGTLRPEDAVRTIRRSAAHLSNLVDGLLDISQIETGALQLHRDHVDFPDFLDQIVDMFRLQATAKGIGFFDERVGTLPSFVHTDEKRLRQILINLLSNALKYTEHGSATLRVQRRGQVTEFEVIDTGHGIRPEDIKTIFEPFERGHMPAANAVPGTGLGLTISKLLSEILGGEISVESTPGKGSTFRVRLLLSEANGNALARTARRITGYAGARQKILIADDDADHVRLLSEILLSLGFIVITTGDGANCLNLFDDARPNLVLLDIAMPGMSGLEVAAQLCTGTATTKILIVSGNLHDAPRPAQDQPPLDYDGFLAKPIDIRALLERIGALLSLDWIFESPAQPVQKSNPANMPRPAAEHLADLLQLGRIGYVRGIETKLTAIAKAEPQTDEFCAHLRALVRGFELAQYMACLESLTEPNNHD
ncbi:MAG: hypothetical protein B7Z81_06035 [Acidocella sp. 20-61-6]|nr:MAG: hypothetical protein B7Z81_06035 [Acidocella sp. 20-61-6]